MTVGSEVLRNLPRLALNNLTRFPGTKAKRHKASPRGQHTGKRRGFGKDGRTMHRNIPRLGAEGVWAPFYIKTPKYPYWKGHEERRQYPPVSLFALQFAVDTGRIDPMQPVDLGVLAAAGVVKVDSFHRHYGVNLTEDGVDLFCVPNLLLEVQWLESEVVLAAVERLGGSVITTYLDPVAVSCLQNPQKFFRRFEPIPSRLLPPRDLVEYYTDPKKRGYLADEKEVALAKQELAQRHGYTLPPVTPNDDDKRHQLSCWPKSMRQVFFHLQPGWIVNLKDDCILKPKDYSKLDDLYPK